RWPRDWSSDVCSSDLDCSYRLGDKSNLADGQQGMILHGMAIVRAKRAEVISGEYLNDSRLALCFGNVDRENLGVRKRAAQKLGRSEGRRVGRATRWRW